MPPRCACIDVGANTTRLLVADVPPEAAPREVLCRREVLPLAPGGDGRIGPAAARRLAGVVAAQVAEARRLGAARLRVVATGPLRAAADRDAVLAAVGTPVDVLSGEEEARLAFAGATAGLDLAGVVGVVDAGGASTELAVGTCRGGASWTASVHVGSAGLAAAHLHGDPPSAAELAALHAAARAALAGLAPPAVDEALAVGGPGSTLHRLCGDRLDEDALRAALAALTGAPALEVARARRLPPEKVRVLPGALALVGAAARAFGRPPRLAAGGLREGVCVALARECDTAPRG